MDNLTTGNIIKNLRIKKGLTQLDLANILCVSDKTISKWETGRGLPDISLLEALSKTLNTSIIELFNGEIIKNNNVSSNIIKSNFYVCPICGNIIHASGKCLISCCGIQLPTLQIEDDDEKHLINAQIIDCDLYISLNHPMTKEHYISFIAYLTYNKCEIVKLYPEQNAEATFQKRGKGLVFAYCNKDGLFKIKI